MRQFNKGLYSILISMVLPLLIFTSCEKSFEAPIERMGEDVYGFNVIWRSQISDNQRSAVQDILHDMVLVEGDYFVMGATTEQVQYARPNEWPTAYVKLSNYYICKHEVTDDEYNRIMGRDVSASDNYASCITLREWEQFISMLNDLTSLPFNFPTEAQWEFAARGGRKTRGFIYPGSDNWKDVCSGSHIEGSKLSNELGLYNLGDLKSEWCLDYYDAYSSECMFFDWVQTKGKYHVVRGGNYRCTIESEKYYPSQNSPSIVSFCLGHEASYLNPEMDYRNCRITSRSYHYDNGRNDIGLRLVLNLQIYK